MIVYALTLRGCIVRISGIAMIFFIVSWYHGVHTNETIPSSQSSHRRDMEFDSSKYYDAHLYSYPHHHHFHKSHNEQKKHEEKEPRKHDDSNKVDEVGEGNTNEINYEETLESDSNWSCEWSPTSHNECSEMISKRVSFVNSTEQTKNQRWLFFGDSTMKRLFLMSNLGKVLIDEPHKKFNEEDYPCKSDLNCDIRRQGDRCKLYGVFGLQPPKKWRKPSFYPKFEGPANYGATHPYCSDCAGCDTEFLLCTQYNSNYDLNKTISDDDECEEEDKLVYGGYMMVEFAKDIELQTSAFRTTQENIAWFIHDQYNTPELLSEWGKPICVILTGFHDMILLIKTEHFSKKHFVENVEWYLTIMQSVCGHIVWVTNTSPSRENPKNWPQTIELTRDWNKGVKEMIERNDDLLEMTTFVDVFEASRNVSNLKDDHIHKIDSWYRHLGEWFSFIITEQEMSDEQFTDQ